MSAQEDIKKEAERFFNEFLTFEPLDVEEISIEDLQDILPFVVMKMKEQDS